MTERSGSASSLRAVLYWRELALVSVALLTLLTAWWLPPIAQDVNYHRFADARPFLGVANFANVASNLPFLLAGIAGAVLVVRRRIAGARLAWAVFFAGVALVALGSSYYHLRPNNDTLVWDRLPMTVAFMGLFVGVVSEHIDVRLERWLLLPAVAVGALSVLWWDYADDLRLYAWVQFTPLLLIAAAAALFPARFSHRVYLLYGLGFYLAAKCAEMFDRDLFALTTVGGHALKHLLAALGASCAYLMLRIRRPLSR